MGTSWGWGHSVPVGCDLDFHCNYFCINKCYKLVGMGALCCCGALTWACIATAVPPPLSPGSNNEKSDNKQCLLDTPRRRQSIIKDSYQNAKVRKKYAYTCIKAMALLRVTKGNNSNSIGP